VEAMDMTRVLVAHRRETIAIADRVFELDPATGLVRVAGASAPAAAREAAAPLP
jgi:hypothetical protein